MLFVSFERKKKLTILHSLFLANQFMFSRLHATWPTGFQRGIIGKSHQNGNYVKRAMRKSCLPAGIEPVAFELPVIV